MANWNEILNQINESPSDRIRRQYLRELHNLTGRNVVAYYSGWLQKTHGDFYNIVSITDDDKAGFMNAFHGLDFSIGLDLILHSPGGYIAATESLIHYMRSKFGRDIRVFVPQIAMSGGTIMALSASEIWLGRESNLGPIDPQFGNQPAVTLLDEIEQAYKEIKADPDRMAIWSPILSKIPPTMVTRAKQAIDLSREIAERTLIDGMFADDKNRKRIAKKIAQALTNVQTHKEHGRHIHFEDCESIGLKVRRLEDDDALQDAVLSIHHAFWVTLANTSVAKIIENHDGKAYIKNVPMR